MTCAQAVVDLAARGCDLVIVSDANSFFIEAILQHHGLLEHFKEVGISYPAILTNQMPLTCISSCHPERTGNLGFVAWDPKSLSLNTKVALVAFQQFLFGEGPRGLPHS